MKRLLPIALLLSSQLFTCAQANKNAGQLDFSMGSAFAVGQFANKDIHNGKAGLASTGGMFSVSYLAPARKKIGIAISLHGQINPVKRHTLENSFSKEAFAYTYFYPSTGLPSGPPPTSTTVYPNWKFKQTSWKLGALMSGGYTELKTKTTKITIASKAMIGLVYAASPKIDGSSVTDTTNVHVTQSSETGFGFSYLLHAGLKFKVSDKFSFLASIEYFGTNNITFKNMVASVTINKYMNEPGRSSFSQTTMTGNGKQTISTLNLSAGLSFRL